MSFKQNTIAAARELAAQATAANASGFKFEASGKFDAITVRVYGFGAPVVHEFKTRRAQCEYLRGRIDFSEQQHADARGLAADALDAQQ